MLIGAPVGGMIRAPSGEGEIVSTGLPRLRRDAAGGRDVAGRGSRSRN